MHAAIAWAGGPPVPFLSLPRRCRGHPLAFPRERSLAGLSRVGNPLGQSDASPLSRPVSLQACMATMYRCVHFWGFKALEDASRRSDASGADEMTVFQMTLCSVLVRTLRGRTCQGLRVSAATEVPLVTLCSPFRREVLRSALSTGNRMQATGPLLSFLVTMLRKVKRGTRRFNNRVYLTQ